MTDRTRLDTLLVERGLAPSRQRAQALILAGAVTVAGVSSVRASTPIAPDAEIDVALPEDALASRGGHKLEAALETFDLTVEGKVALDVGASTGGFTDVLLRHGAKRVYAVDVGYGQLAWRLRGDDRVVVMERTNFRHVDSLPELPEVATVDVSFISLALILPALTRVTAGDAEAVVLVKPQFEAGKGNVSRGGVVRDPAVRRSAIESVVASAETNGWAAAGVTVSPLRGPAGNYEYLVHLSRDYRRAVDIAPLIDALFASEKAGQ